MEIKVFNDLVHGHMIFHPLIVAVVDTRHMQRLRNIKQLGACYFVYPSASHNRFEHCLGTAHIAGQLIDNLKKKQKFLTDEEEKKWEQNKLCVQIAGLCHDVGHGPFSHTWEKFHRRVHPDENWTHEVESMKIFNEILDESISPTKKFNGKNVKTVRDAFELYGLNSGDIAFIKRMILGNKTPKNYLYQIVSNKNNDIDVDKWDYLARDSIMLNLPVGFDYRRLLNFCRILKNSEGEEEICFREKECSLLIEMFMARGRLHDKAYQHVKVKIIEEMLIDAFELANERMKLTDTPVSQLTDHIFYKILYEDFGSDENMLNAKKILRRIENRNLYECLFRKPLERDIQDTKDIKKQIGSAPGLGLYISDIDVITIKLDMTVSNKEKALKNVLVYSKANDENISSTKFDWHKYQDSLKPNLEKMERYQLLVLYKGEKQFPDSLKCELEDHFQRNQITISEFVIS
ncbi:hypothetical protein RUM44_006201 [Polyplax serrata]|uniref:HD/PDEase domain-containing protein n=1 Tax=Polyplax serrata TaxID=468196 RepID=A0ABR1AHF8_POLSC